MYFQSIYGLYTAVVLREDCLEGPWGWPYFRMFFAGSCEWSGGFRILVFVSSWCGSSHSETEAVLVKLKSLIKMMLTLIYS